MANVPESRTQGTAYTFGPFQLFPDRQLLMRDGVVVKLGGRAFELLHALVRRSGEIIGRDDLIAAAWPGVFVHESNLKVNMHSLRRSLSDTQKQPAYIATIAGRGYRFVATVETELLDLSDLAPIENAVSGNLPVLRDVIGRDRETGHILGLLRAGDTHISVVGAGGVGKTTVALAAASAYAEESPGGVCFVDLSKMDDPTYLPSAVFAALGLRGDAGDPLTAVSEHLRQRQMLLLLDNCEHVLPAVSILALKLRSMPSRCKLLVTSREPVGVPAEHVYLLNNLAFPDSGARQTADELLRFPAVELFVRRASEWTGYHFSDRDCHAIAEICRALDGLPLAIELVAANMEAITPDKLLAMLDEHLVFRNRFADAAPNRHETLLATIDWSFGLLSETEATIFCLTSVFSDTFELEDAVAIAAAHSLSPLEVIAGLGGLVGKSLIAAQVNGAGLRYRLLDSTRRYARNRMQAAGLEQKSQRAHAERVLRLFEQSESEWGWRDKQEWVHNYHSRLADLRVALRWAFGDEGDLDLGVRLTASTIPLWTEASLVDEARNRVELAMKEADRLGCDPLLRAKLALAWAWSMMYGRPYTPGIGEAWAAAHEHAEKAGALDHQLQALVGHSYFLMDTGHISQAIKRLEKFESLADLHHYRQLDPECISAKAWAKAHSGNMVESLTELETLTIAHSHNPQPTRKHGLLVDRNSGIRGHIPLFAWVTGRVDYAATVAEETLEAAERDGMLTSQSNVLAQALCPVSFYRGDLDSLHLNVLRLHSILEMDTIGVWLPVQRFYAAALDDLEGDHNADQRMKAAIDEFIDSRFFLRVPGCLCTLADIYVRKGKLEDATNAMDLAEKYESQHGERWCRSELMRIKARLLSSKGDVLRSEHLLLEARDEARFSNALSFELRIASDLANGFLDRGRYDDAKRILQPVYAKFDEGFTTRDMGIAFELIKRAEIYQQRS